MIHEAYVKARNRIPERLIESMKTRNLPLSMIRRFQPPQDAILLYRVEGPLRAHRMRIPTGYAYPMVWGTFEPDMCKAIEDFVKPGWTVLDLGAHIGYHTLMMAARVGNEGRVISFEPLPENQVILRENITINGYAKIVCLETMAVAEETCLQRLNSSKTSSEAFLDNTSSEANLEKKQFIVPTCCLDDYFRLQGWPCVHLVKIDIEGAESRAIAGMEKVINRHRPIFIIESHGEHARSGLLALIRKGYAVSKLDLNGNTEQFDLASWRIGNEHWLLLP